MAEYFDIFGVTRETLAVNTFFDGKLQDRAPTAEPEPFSFGNIVGALPLGLHQGAKQGKNFFEAGGGGKNLIQEGNTGTAQNFGFDEVTEGLDSIEAAETEGELLSEIGSGIGNWFVRGIVVILGFIFVSVGLSMFKVGPVVNVAQGFKEGLKDGLQT